MGVLRRKSPLEKEYEKARKAEEKLVLKKSSQKESVVNRLVGERIPPKLQETLEKAFAKAFTLLFTKGTGVIERTYNRDKLRKDYLAREAAHDIKKDRKSIKAFTRSSKNTGRKNLFLSGTFGIGTGLVGVGLPDIPVFSSMLLKQIYQTATEYGFPYKGEKENYFILKLIEGAFSQGDRFMEINEEVNLFMEKEELPEDYNFEEEIGKASSCLSGELLYSKFVQGIPLVGAAGGAYDALYMKRAADYSLLKYRQRFLRKKLEGR